MPRLQRPIFPAESKCVSRGYSVECRDKQVVYFSSLMPIFQHAEDDLRSFRMFTSLLIVMDAARQVDIAKVFGVPLPTVKRYLKLLRDHGQEGFFTDPKPRSAPVLTDEIRQLIESLIAEGKNVPEVAEASGVKANTLHKAIRAGRLPRVKKKNPPRIQYPSSP